MMRKEMFTFLLSDKFSLLSSDSFFLFVLINSYFIYLFIYLAVLGLRFVRGLSLVAASRGHSSSWCTGLSYCGPSRCGAQASEAQAKQLWLTGPVAPWHVGSFQTRARTRVPCIGRQILNHCATREALSSDS